MKHTFLAVALQVGIGAACGALLGLAYCTLLRRAVEAFRTRPSGSRLLGGSAVRMLAAGSLLAALAWIGPAALLSALPGFWRVRAVLLRRYGDPRAVRAGERQ